MTGGLRDLIDHPVRFHFFTGKGGVGDVARVRDLRRSCRSRATTLLVSTDPASNLDAVLGVTLGNSPVRARCRTSFGHEH
jgi:arsenite-transporting ATPase